MKDDFPHFLKTGPTPPRFRYFNRILADTIGSASPAVLDVGCGNGFLSEHFAAAGCSVTGIDPSIDAIETAREHADRMSLPVSFAVASPEQLPFGDASFDAVSCCDVLEHTPNTTATLAEAVRVLRPGGLLLYATINRTWRSRIAVGSVQKWFWTRITGVPLYDWKLFITPDELSASFAKAGLELRDIVGIRPHISPYALFRQMHKLHRGDITYGEFGRRSRMGATRDISVSYMGYAVRK